MNLSKFEIYSYQNKSLIIQLINEIGKEGVGEISPFWGRNHETFEEALLFTKKLRERFLRRDFSPILFPPSVMFGVEMALLSLLSPLKEDLSFELTRLLSDPIQGERNVKIKLKDLSLPQAIAKTEQFLASGSTIRIDLNRAWDLATAIEFCSHFHPRDFLYIEDPVSLFTDLEKFYDQTGFSYAVDEYLVMHPLERILPLRGLTHLIIKPTCQGGLNRCKLITEQAKGKTCVFSSAYETGIGLMHIARIATTLNPNHPIGIDTPSSLIPFNPQERLLKKELYHQMPIAWNTLDKVI